MTLHGLIKVLPLYLQPMTFGCDDVLYGTLWRGNGPVAKQVDCVGRHYQRCHTVNHPLLQRISQDCHRPIFIFPCLTLIHFWGLMASRSEQGSFPYSRLECNNPNTVIGIGDAMRLDEHGNDANPFLSASLTHCDARQ